MKALELLLAQALAVALNERGAHRTVEQNVMLDTVADKVADALSDIRFEMGRK